MRLRTLLLATALMSGEAYARSDKPIMAGVPDWVKPVTLPPLPEKNDEAPLRVMLADQQTKLEPGRVSNYIDIALRLQTPQGLAAGNLSFAWNPETDDLTVHKLILHRDGVIIDVLAGGQTFTIVRREPNLEGAMLDGVLTANIQPEGLQVGDILEYAITIASSDPVLKDHVEQTGASWNVLPFTRAHFRMLWPNTLPVTIRQEGALPQLKPVKSGATTSVELSLENVEPVIPPQKAPARFSIGRVAEFSNFKSWAEAGALLAPLYDVAARVPAEGPLRNELEKMKTASADPVKRAEAALALVQDRVRYVALLMGAGGLVPANAAETWSRRYGDCKAKTALLLALLHELGIEAEPVAVNAISGDGLDKRLPMIGLFNHVLVRAHIGGRAYWLDGTRSGDTSLGRLVTPYFGWGLPLLAKNAALVRMLPEPLEQPDYDLQIDIDARSGLSVPAPVKAQVVLRGDDAVSTRLTIASMTAEARDNMLRDYWKERLDELEVAKVNAAFDPATGIETLTMEGKTSMDWSDSQYWTDSTGVGFEADFSRTAGPNDDAPFAMGYPSFARTIEKIQLPPGFSERNIFRKEPIEETVAGIEYRRHASLADNVFMIERTTRTRMPEFAAKDAPAARKRLKELSDLQVSIRKPNDYRLTQAEIDRELATTPTDSAGYFRRGMQLGALSRVDEAMAAWQKALDLDPGNEDARSAFAGTASGIGRIDLAAKLVEDLKLSDIKTSMLAGQRGYVAMYKGDFPAAIAAFTRSVELNPANSDSLARRGGVYYMQGKTDLALIDTAASLKINAKQPGLYLMRANILKFQGKTEEALAEARAAEATDPGNDQAHVVAARIYGFFSKTDEAMKAFDCAIAIKPAAYIYVNRAEVRPKSDVEGRLADYDAALALEPAMQEAIVGKSTLLAQKGDSAGAIRMLSELIAKAPANGDLRMWRGLAYTRAGRLKEADADFVAARSRIGLPGLLNNHCYAKAKEGIALESALADCDAALAKQPDYPNFLDSKALVLLRMGRIDEAITTFDKVLATAPGTAPSLFGRALAWSRKGDKAKADADRAAALKVDSNVQKEFEGFGLTLQ